MVIPERGPQTATPNVVGVQVAEARLGIAGIEDTASRKRVRARMNFLLSFQSGVIWAKIAEGLSKSIRIAARISMLTCVSCSSASMTSICITSEACLARRICVPGSGNGEFHVVALHYSGLPLGRVMGSTYAITVLTVTFSFR